VVHHSRIPVSIDSLSGLPLDPPQKTTHTNSLPLVVAIQAEYAPEPAMIPQASALATFGQLMGGTLGISVGGTVFANQLTTNLAPYAQTLGPELIKGVRQSVTVIFSLPQQLQQPVVDAYVKSVATMYITIVPCMILAGICGMFVKNWNLKTRGGGF
jgi:hypothetical protein